MGTMVGSFIKFGPTFIFFALADRLPQKDVKKRKPNFLSALVGRLSW
jgi:hypothetical protein